MLTHLHPIFRTVYKPVGRRCIGIFSGLPISISYCIPARRKQFYLPTLQASLGNTLHWKVVVKPGPHDMAK